MPMTKIVFEPNVPVQIALRFPDGKIEQGRFGDQMYYSLVDGRCMYVGMPVAEKINALDLREREPFMICKRVGGRKTTPTWDVFRPGEGEVMPAPGPRAVAALPPLPPLQSTGDIEAQLLASLERVRQQRLEAAARVDVGHTSTPVSAAPQSLVRPATQPPSHSNGNGSSNGHNGHRPYEAAGVPPPPVKIPMDVAVTEVVRMVQQAMKDTGEQWSDNSRQDLVATVLIAAQREGWVTIWNRGAR